MRTVKVVEVMLWDGGERHNFAYYLDGEKNTAKDIETKIKHSMCFTKVLQIFDNQQDVENNKPANIKKAALMKLTDLEKQVLGIKE